MNEHQSEMGQTTVELLASASLLVISITGMGYLFKAEWERGKCAYLAFEKTHAAATGSLVEMPTQDLPDSVKGFAFCQGSPEVVTIPKLEVER